VRNEVLVVRLPPQHFVDERQVQRVVALGSHLPVVGGLAGREAGARIDVGAAHPVRHRGHEGLGFFHHERLDQIAAVEHEVLGVLQVEEELHGADAAERARGVVNVSGAAGIVVEVVRRAQRLHEGPRQIVEGAASIGKRDSAPAEGPDCFVQLVGDVVERLVPGRPPPLAAAAGAHADQRRLRPLVVVVLESHAGGTLGAEASADGHVVRIALYPCHATVLDSHFDRATDRAHAAHAEDRALTRGTHAAHVRCHRVIHHSLRPSIPLGFHDGGGRPHTAAHRQ
jgi:hypothetical protein